MSFTRQVEELTLLQCSLLPDEILEFTHPRSDDLRKWRLAIGERGDASPTSHVSCPACFSVRIDGSPLWFEVEVSDDYPQKVSGFDVGVRGHDISRAEQQRWQDIVRDERSKLEDTAYPLYELFSLHLLPQLREEYLTRREVSQTKNATNSEICTMPNFHALFTSHHLKSPQKRRSLQQWASELQLTGFAKVGHPGLIYCSGSQANIEEFVTRVKEMQWLALRLRFMEPLYQSGQEVGGREWTEVEKIGEVVEKMKKLGRETYVLDLGIGSGGTK